MGRGAQDRAMQLMSKNQGWDPTEIVDFTRGGSGGNQQIEAYDAEKGNALRWSHGYGDMPGPDSGSKTMGDVNVGMNDTNGIQFAEERAPGTGVKYENSSRHFPGKPM